MPSFLESFAIKVGTQEVVAAVILGGQSKGRAARFIKGPIPAEWLEQAARLSGKALHAALAIRYLDGFDGTGTVKLPPSVRNAYGMDRFSCARALEQLEEAGLIKVTRKPGAAPTVTIVSGVKRVIAASIVQ